MIDRVSMDDSQLAIVAAEAGASVLRARYGTQLTQFRKSAWDFATEADLESERAILDVLRAARPRDALVGEESGAANSGISGRTWLVDPLCGTVNFAARTPLVSVNVALHEGNDVRVAAVAEPLGAQTLWTDGAGAYARRDDRDEAISASAQSRLVDLNLDSPYHLDGNRFRSARIAISPRFEESFRARVTSSTLALAWVADGSRAAYVTDGDVRDSVHFAAGIALCRAAGCIVTGLRGQPLHTGVNGLVAAADEETHAALVGIINEQFTEA